MLLSHFTKSAAATLLLLTVGLAAPAHAQQNKQIISGTWYEDRAVSTGDTGLVVTFTQSPTNKFLNITSVYCTITVSTQQILADVFLQVGSVSGSPDLARPMPIRGNATPETLTSSKYYVVIPPQVFFKVGPGRYPSIQIDAPGTSGSGSIYASCVIIGNLTDN